MPRNEAVATDRDTVFLSVILPAYNERRRLGPALEQLSGFVAEQPFACEVLVVDNGSTDGTAEVAGPFAGKIPRLRVIREEQTGKGLAVRRGMLEARGEYCFMCDVDFSMPAREMLKFLPPALQGVDVAIGSREAPGSQVVSPALRKLMGKGFNLLARLTTGLRLWDSQCGFKCFSRRAAKEVFRRQSLNGFSFDVESLVIAHDLGYSIREVPIAWHHDADSRVRVVRDSLRMAADLLTIRRNLKRGMYR